MTPEDLNREADALYGYLRGERPRDDPDLPAAEAAFLDSLLLEAQKIQSETQFQAALEKRLASQALAKQRWTGRRKIGIGVAWAALVILMVVGLVWVLGTLAPQGGPAVSSAAVLPSLTAPVATSQPTQAALTPPPTATSQTSLYTSSMFPNEDLILEAEFPVAPTEVTVSLQIPAGAAETITVDSARAAAQKLGVNGYVYEAPGSSPDALSYMVVDGVKRVTFTTSTRQYEYIPDSTLPLPVRGSFPPQDELSAKAEQYLKTHDLLDFPYRLETVENAPGTVRFLQLLDGIPVHYNIRDLPHIDVQFTQAGEIARIEAYILNFQAVSRYPIISAEEAWQKVIATDTQSGIETGSWFTKAGDFRSWTRAYTPGEKVEMFGFIQTLKPAEAEAPILAFLNNYPLAGDLQGLAEAAKGGELFQVWGTFQTDSDGAPVLQVEGWQASPFRLETLEGQVQREGGKAYFLAEGRRLLLPSLPADVPEGVKASTQGVVLEQPEPTLEWSYISIGSGGGGGGGGGLSFAELNLSGPPATQAPPVPTPTLPFQTGTKVEGARGIPSVLIHQYTDGSTQAEVFLEMDPNATWPEGTYVSLEGPGLKGIEVYYNLPVLVWGAFGDLSGSIPKLIVERVEPVYPDLAGQAWLGSVESVTLEDEPVLLFTAQDGQQFVLKSSIDSPGPDQTPGAEGDPLVVEGITIPDQAFGGYPVITDFSMSPGQGLNDLSNYQVQSLTPPVIQEAGLPLQRRVATIDRIELVYYTPDLRNTVVSPSDPPSYAQPVWRFSGSYADGTLFEILVQALSPLYLR
jgi:hypothetical protein